MWALLTYFSMYPLVAMHILILHHHVHAPLNPVNVHNMATHAAVDVRVPELTQGSPFDPMMNLSVVIL